MSRKKGTKLNLWEKGLIKGLRWGIGRAQAFGRFLDEVEVEAQVKTKKAKKKGKTDGVG